ncbi:MAG: hypothetical protein ISEC1_P0902 [Thiomicrorhabdus sp.]|nr:MAG: hypothetical protein ISEC1_P0902 [Thiomicrorhabdus sp.]
MIKNGFPYPKFVYGYAMLKSEREDWGEEYDYVVVWLDIEKVIKLTKHRKQKWPHLTDWVDGKIEIFIDAWSPHKEDLEAVLCFMPRITLCEPSASGDVVKMRDVIFAMGTIEQSFSRLMVFKSCYLKREERIGII